MSRPPVSLALRWLAVLLAWALVATAAGPASAAPARFRRCPDVIYRVKGGAIRTYALQALRTACPGARRVASGWILHAGGAGPARPLGFRCRPRGTVGVVCTKGARVVRWRFAP